MPGMKAPAAPGRGAGKRAPVRAAAPVTVAEEAVGLRERWAALPPAARLGLALGLALTLAGLLAHAWYYRFLTDDAFISFRYARNLSQGFGLVFNPGFERVEGYSNFLWTLLLAGFDRLGLAPERVANPFSLIATAGLWGVTTWFALRRAPVGSGTWIAWVPALLLAATRSIAVWSTSGLETRLFEFLLVAGALRLVVELESELAGSRRASLAAWLFALATLTRPDGLLVSVTAFAAAAWILWRRDRLVIPAFLLRLLPFLLVIAHFVFRRVYYGDWLPNTYYAKVGGRTWFSAGAQYLEMFALEYAMWLWVPLIVLGVRSLRRRNLGYVPLLFAAILLPHLLYVASVGGDHFEYRPLDLYLPFLYLLLAEGLRALDHGRAGRIAAVAALVVILVGIWEIPWQSHRQFPSRYASGFPGIRIVEPEARYYLDPDRDPIYSLPGLSALARRHRELLGELSRHFVGLRQEEHRMFLASVVPEGQRLGELVRRGVLPRDLHIALVSVGAIPYYSDLRTLDILGLTDAHVAHSEPALPPEKRVMAHDKRADLDYATRRGVDLWPVEGVHLVMSLTSGTLLRAVARAVNHHRELYQVELKDGEFLVALLPQGAAHAAARMPNLRLRAMDDSTFAQAYLGRAIAANRDSARRDPTTPRHRFDLAYLLLIAKQYDEARGLYLTLARETPLDLDVWERLTLCELFLGKFTEARTTAERGLVLSIEREDEQRVLRFREHLARLGVRR